ncbi:heat-inducible transcription repressor HrcA [candidate division KSB1 bacterium]|nr:heat-inducible transcription repressor HrcA [candidate division KSB1 bacterium]RQW00672.1 MAG: heat-inducible transcription repressor HrcA [candidate division KSB1 bacterium]
MSTIELTERERQVFLAIVHGFTRNAEPVGSRYISKNYHLNISPATVRNVMADLEELGLIWQPHTSAGRIPTTHGYRVYVDSLGKGTYLTKPEKKSIIKKLEQFTQDADRIIGETARILGDISSQLGIVLSPRFTRGLFKNLELIQISEQKLLVILSIESGLVKSVIIEIENQFSSDFLNEISQLINDRLRGLSIEQLSTSFHERFSDVDAKSKDLIDKIKDNTDKMIQFEPESDIHFFGAKNVIANPEFGSVEQVGKVLELLDRKDVLVRVLSEHSSNDISIVIGDESAEELTKNCSIITTTYSIDGAIGTLGVLGPTRMQYAKIISLVKFMADTLTYFVSKKN